MRVYDPQGVYTPAEVRDALTAPSGIRDTRYRFELLDSNNVYKKDLDLVASGEVTNNYLADIKRKAKFSIRDDGSINYLSDRIKPYAMLKMSDGGYVEWPLGVFLLSTPSRSYQDGAVVLREIQGYDQLLVLQDDKVTARHFVAAGTQYTAAITTLLTGMNLSLNITASPLTLAVDQEWEPGTSKLKILNELLGAINYESATFNEDGVLVCRPYISPSARASEYTYAVDADSVLSGNIEQTLDLYSIPNQWTRSVSEPDRAPLTSTYINNSPSSPTSTVNRGRVISDFDTDDAPDQATLNAKTARLGFEASQVYEIVQFETIGMPVHQNNDVFVVEIDDLALNAAFSEHEWSLPLEPGALMRHKARRIVSV